MTRIATIIFGLVLITSCDCNQIVAGRILDKVTGKPLQGVTVFNKQKNWEKSITDSSGHFELSAISGGFTCPSMTVIAALKNYNRVELEIPAGGNETILLQPVLGNTFSKENKYFDLTKTINLKVISHCLASVECGVLETASTTIGTIENGDTIVVLELCNTKKIFMPNEIVEVIPAAEPNFGGIISECTIENSIEQTKTYKAETSNYKLTYGTIQRK